MNRIIPEYTDNSETCFVEFFEKGGCYTGNKNIQFFATTKWLQTTFGGIINLLKKPAEKTVEENK